ncbi:T9SS type B sorting domain-containing protein [Flavobacterium sp. AC]|uniref:T9SS type B sorting domain-containing protein n=1 Tax=Flavobacterium azizsancarii TaxID=2961580 RepID=A0ABT4WEC0_9FLAO|nr:T9SS type B sorting domain-containing protein [Flavobacterium azizsancarii]MDA6070904.1 T9SS type B sorting domain-containing protein [Flavobacterium azizsancarii]
MKKPTILRMLIFVLAMLFNFASYSQNGIAYNSKFPKNLNENIFLKANNQLENPYGLETNVDPIAEKAAAPIIQNPVLKYAQGEYAGTISICPNNGDQLPKLFLCGTNDPRLIDTGISPTTATVVWSRLSSGCTPFANVNCANQSSACGWQYLSTGQTFSANTAGEFKLVITYPDKTVFTFYFNVYTSDIDPTNISKTNIITGGANSCIIPGTITVKGFGTGYEYAIDPGTNTPTTGWQDSSIFSNITAAKTYNVFIRLKNVPGTCVFKVKNVAITSAGVSVSTNITHPKCDTDKGSILARTSDLGLKYYYRLYRGNTLQTQVGPISAPEYPFNNLDPANDYRVEVAINNTPCAPFNSTGANLKINPAPSKLLVTLTDPTNSSGCDTPNIQINASGGTAAYKYYVSINGGDFVLNGSNIVTVTTTGKYDIRVEDFNGCLATASTTRNNITKPDYTVTPSNPNCNTTTGTIKVTVNKANGYSMGYSLNGAAYTSGTTGVTYNNLAPGSYTVKVRYRLTNNASWCEDTNVVTILDAPNALTASAGVAKLSGCGVPNKTDGLVRITNPSGGTPPYTYSFDGGKNYITSNEAYKAPNPGNPYTLYIKDSSLPTPCIYPMPGIIIDPKPADPEVRYSELVYSCDGTATMTATATNPGGVNYTYTYLLDDIENTNIPSNVFTNIKSGKHVIKVIYNLQKVSTYSNLLTEDFGRGNPTTSPGINPAYCFENQAGNHPANYPCNKDREINDGEYAVTNRINPRFGSWLDMRDHTSGGSDSQGRFLAINIGGVAGIGGIIYRKPIYDVIPNQDVKISFWVANLINNLPANSGNDDPNITIQLIADYGLPTQTLVASQETGVVPKSNKWENYNMNLNPGAYTTLDFVVRSYSAVDFGNDLTLDDITVYQIPESCGSVFKNEFEVPENKEFTGEVKKISDVVCNGDSSGKFEIYAYNFNTTNGFDYTIDGTNWFNSKVSPVTVPNSNVPGKLVGKTYDVRVRYSLDQQSCNKLIPTEVTEPTKFDVTTETWPANCDDLEGKVVLTPTGGVLPYSFKLVNNVNGKMYTFFKDPVTGKPTLTNVPSGSYIVSGTDGNSCPWTLGTALTVGGSTAPLAKIDGTSNLCFNKNTGATITVKIIGGKGKFQYKVRHDRGAYSNLSAPFDGPTFTYVALAEGNYDFVIVDANGCSTEAVSQTINPVFGATPSIKATLSCKAGAAEAATILVTISGGTSPFNYTVTNSLGVQVGAGNTTTTTFEYTTTISDTYTFDIVDKNKCPIKITQKVSDKIQVTAESKPNNATCFGTKNGSVDLKGLTGVAPYTFEFNGTGGFGDKTHYDGLEGSVAGIEYTFIVKDGNECTKSYSFKIYQPEDISGKAEISTAYTCDHAATITVSEVKGGTPQYKYTLLLDNVAVAGPQDGLTFSNLSVAGEYKVIISDANACSKTITVGTISALNKPVSMKIDHSAVTCPTNLSKITITDVKNAAGVILTSGLEYRMVLPTAGTFSANNTFTDLAAGVEYTFEVKDANNCKVQDKHFVPLPQSFTVGSKSTPVSCFTGSTDGTATFAVTGIDAGTDYTYKVDLQDVVTKTSTGSPFDIVITGLGAGDHKIVVTNSTTNCPITEIVKVLNPTAALTLNDPDLTHVTCKDQGTAVINAVGGWGTYTYTVTRTAPLPAGTPKIQVTNNKFIDLAPGTYSVSVSDLRGCVVTNQNFIINDFVKPSAEIDVTSSYCAGGAGATLIATPKLAPKPNPNYEYKLNTGNYQPSGTFSGLVPGDYTITVRDIVTGCTDVLAKQTIAKPLSATPRIEAALTCDPTSPEAKIEVSIFNGYPDYSYKVNTTGAPFTGSSTAVGIGQTKFTYPALEGTYYFEITDSKGCTVVVSQKIDPTVKPDFTTDLVDVKCKGDNTGSITVYTTPALGTYKYVLNTVPATTEVTQSTNLFEGLTAGKYSIYVIDAKKCKSDAKEVEIKEPLLGLTVDPKVTTELLCDASNNAKPAKITVTVSGGTPFPGTNPYRYSYNGVMPPVLSNVYTTTTAGTVTVQVFDASNCSLAAPIDVEIKALDSPTKIEFKKPAPITCETDHDKTSLKIDITGGVLPLQYEITSPIASTVTVYANTYTFTGLTPGHYYFKVTDANKCTIIGDYEIDDVVGIETIGSIVSNVTCNGLSNGSIKFTVSGNRTGGYTYTLVGSISGTISTIPSVSGDVITYTGLKGGEKYTFTVTNTATECFATDFVTLSEPVAITAFKAEASKIYCSYKKTEIKVSATAVGSVLYYAVVKTGDPVPTFPTDYQTSGLFTKDTSIDGITYTAYVVNKDGNCKQDLPVTVDSDDEPTIDEITVPQCYSGTNFTVTITGSVYGTTKLYGLDGTYDTNPVKTITGPGTYTLGIKDDHNCEKTTTITVNDKLTIDPVIIKDLTCPTTPPTATAAHITLSATGGDGTYSYEYKLESTGTYTTVPAPGNTFDPTANGDYYFKVTSDGCSAETSVPVKVTTPVAPVITSVTEVQSIKCHGDENAAIKIVINDTKGVAPFVFNVKRTGPTVFDYGTQTTDLSAGDYLITVTDGKGCTGTKTITIDDIAPIAFELGKLDITCNNPGGSSLGEITVKNLTGGTAPFKYYITNNFGDVIAGNPYVATGREPHTFTVIKYGIYTVNVVDANGCNLSHKETIASPPEDLTINVALTPSDCVNGGSAKISVVSPVGSHNYRFGILESNDAPYTSTWYTSDVGFPDDKTFTNLTPGVIYTFVVHDLTTQCYYVKAADDPIKPASPMKSVVTAYNVTCKGLNDGSVKFSLSDFDSSTTTVEYAIFSAFNNVQVYPAPVLPVDPTTLPLSVSVPIAAPGTITLPSPGLLSPGTYYIKFIEKGTGSFNGCKSASATFEIKESSVELSVKASVLKNENCNTLGSIIAEAKDGTAPYSYFASTSATTPLPADTGWQSSGTFDKVAGTYYIFAKDANGCIKPATTTVNLVKDPDPVFDLAVVDKCAANGAFTVNVTVTDPTPTMAPYSVSVNGGNFKSFTDTYAATGLNSGLQTIIVQNKNGCPVTHKITINPTPSAKAEIKKVISCPTDGLTVENAEIEVTITGGTGDFEYVYKKDTGSYPTTYISVGVGQTSFIHTVTSANSGTYTFKIKDANGCITETNPVVIEPNVPIVETVKPIMPLCIGGTGTIELSAVGGKGAYTYTLERTLPIPAPAVTKSTGLFTGLAAGEFIYTIKDALGCEVTGPVVLDEPELLKLEPAKITQFACGAGNAAQPAKVELSATGGTGVYEYSFDGSDFDLKNIYTVNAADADRNIPYAVRDANGCIDAIGSVLIPKLVKPSNFDITPSGPITCDVSKIILKIENVTGRTGATYSYATIAPSPIITTSTTGSFPDLTPGTYMFRVTDIATGCNKDLEYTIDDVIKINIEGQSLTDITCFGTDNGKASFLVTGFGTATYTYKLDTDPAVTGPTDGKIELTNLTPGDHRITVLDNATNCSMFIDFNIATPTELLVIDKKVTPLGCTTDGKVVITADKGWGSYLFTLTDPDGTILPTKTDGIFGGLKKVGVYNFSVKDAKGCTLTDTFELFTPKEPVATIAASSLYCYTGTGVGKGATIVVNATTPGTPAYTPVYEYSIDNGETWQGNTFTDVGPGDYDVTVRDQFGCKAIVSVPVKINGQLFASSTIQKELYCTVNTDGIIRLEAVGGYPAYSYTVTKDTGLPAGPFLFTDPGFTDYVVTASGFYKFTITDTKGCSYDIPAIEMTAPKAIDFTAVPTSPYCVATPAQGDSSNGQILVTLTGVTDNPPYTYTLTRTAPTAGTVAVKTDSGLFTGLIAGTYEVTVESEKDCPSTTPNIVIAAPIAVVAKAEAAKFECTQPANAIKRTIVTVTGEGGTGSGTGAVSDYTYSDGSGWYTSNEFTVDAPIAPQTFTYSVKDKNGCVDDVQIIINPFPVLKSAKAALLIAADCPNLGIETIKVDIVGGTGAFEYQVAIDGGLYSTPATSITAGDTFNYPAPAGHTYQFKITDVNTLCTILTNTHEVPLYNIMKVFATASSQVTCNGLSDGKITINIEDYTGNYNYDVLLGGVSVANGTGINATTNNPYIITGLAAGLNYIVKVTQTDYPSCDVESNPVTITQPAILDINGVDIKPVNQNCHNKGTITVDPASIVGGTRPYQFAILPLGQIVTDGDYSGVAIKEVVTNKIFPLFDTWVVYVKDANGCPQSKQVNISLDPLPIIRNVKVLSQCPADNKYEIEVTAEGLAKLQYSLDGVNYQDSNILKVSTPGDYQVWVWDKNQCPVTAPASVTVLKPLTLRAEVQLPICKNADGKITLFAEGGTVSTPSSYVYTKNGGPQTVDNVFTDLAAGVYFFKVIDIVTGCEKEIREEITLATDIIGMKLTARKTSCNTYEDGSILVSLPATNDNPPYTYSISGMGITPIIDQTSAEFNDLRSGTYRVTVKSGRGCEFSDDIFVPEPDAIVVTASNTQFACTTGNTPNKAVITVDKVEGGSMDFVRYQFIRNGVPVQNGPLKTYTQTDYLRGDYVVNVYDSNNCLGVTTVPLTVSPFATLDDLSFVVVTPITCAHPETLQVNVGTTGTFTGPLKYTLTGDNIPVPLVNSDGLFAGLEIGNYLITVESPTGCVISNYHNVFNPNTFRIQAVATNGQICYGATNGKVDLTFIDDQPTPSNDASAFNYTIDSVDGGTYHKTGTTLDAGPFTISGLAAGQYKVVATMVNPIGCTVETVFVIEQPIAALELTVEHTEITCAAGDSDGTITASANGGWIGDYQFELVGPVNSAYSDKFYFDKLPKGDYTINVRDIKGCIDTKVVKLDLPTPIKFTAAANASVLTCFGGKDGIITVSAPTGGQGSNYNYTLSYVFNGEVVSWGPQTTNTFTGLGSGVYTVTVRDGFTCEKASTAITIADPAIVQPSLVLATGITCLTDARLTLSATGGTAPYTYSEDGINDLGSFSSSVTFSVNIGRHRYFVKDKLGCVSILSNEVPVEALEPLAIELDSTSPTVNCKGESTAIIVAKATGGLGNYQYSLLNGAGVEIRPDQNDGIFADLNVANGPYTVHVKSGDCKADSVIIIVTEPQNPLVSSYDVIPVKCFADKNGAINVTASGGTGVIKYAISPHLDQLVETGNFDRLEAGTYTVLVQDVLGCNNVYVIEVKEPAPLIASEIPNTMLPEICKGDKDGAFSIQIKGGVAPYFESLDNDKGPFIPVTGLTKDYINQVGGIHNVFIKDSNGCISKVEIRMPEAVILDPTYDINYDCVNNAQTNMVTITVDKSNTDLSEIYYSLDSDVGPGQPGNIFTNVAPGRHYIVAIHSNGCKVPTASFDIKAYDPLTLAVSGGKPEMNIISVTAAGGAPAYEYSFNGEPFTSSNRYKIYKSGDYVVVVRDKNGCTVTITVPAIYVDVCLDNYFTPAGVTNTTWGPGCTNIYNNLEFSIFDRYGRVIVKYHYGQKWDGRYNGADLPSGDYWYVLKLNDPKDDREFVGHFTLYR